VSRARLFSVWERDLGEVRSLAFNAAGTRAAVNYLWAGLTLRTADDREIPAERASREDFQKLELALSVPTYNEFGALGSIQTIDLQAGKVFTKVATLGPVIEALAFSSDGRALLTVNGKDTSLRALQGGHSRVLAMLGDDTRGILSAQFSSDGQTLASVADQNGVVLREVRTGKVIARLEPPDEYARSLDRKRCGYPYTMNIALNRHADRVACTGEDYAVWVTDVRTGKSRMVPNKHAGKQLEGKGYPALALSPDGRFLAVPLLDNTVQLTDFRSNEFRILRGHTGYVRALAFSPDSKTLATGGDDRTVRLWRMP
jgi:WD40 repeat protein